MSKQHGPGALGSMTINLDMDELLSTENKIRLFFDRNPESLDWCRRNIESYMDKISLTVTNFRVYALVYVWLSLDDEVDRVAWAMRPEEIMA